MNIREELEAKELEYLSPYASCSGKSRAGKEKRRMRYPDCIPERQGPDPPQQIFSENER